VNLFYTYILVGNMEVALDLFVTHRGGRSPSWWQLGYRGTWGRGRGQHNLAEFMDWEWPMQPSIEIIHPHCHFRLHHLRTPIIDVVASDLTIGSEPTHRSTQKHGRFLWCCHLGSSEDRPCVDDASASPFSTRCN
jgi:hypothetical protein